MLTQRPIKVQCCLECHGYIIGFHFQTCKTIRSWVSSVPLGVDATWSLSTLLQFAFLFLHFATLCCIYEMVAVICSVDEMSQRPNFLILIQRPATPLHHLPIRLRPLQLPRPLRKANRSIYS